MEIVKLNKFGIEPSEINKYINRVKSPNVSVAITGEFSAGKSTFLNALMNKENFLPNTHEECTPVFVELVKSNSSVFNVAYRDGSVANIDINNENIREFITYKDGYDDNVLGITLPIGTENNGLNDNITLIDTPGTNTIIKQHEGITEYILKKVDIAIYVVNKVVGESDIQRINELYKYTKDIIIVVTHMDEIVDGKWVNRDPKDIDRLIEEVRSEITKHNEVFGCIEVLPVGSMAAYEHDEYISEIRGIINEYVNENNQKVILYRVKSQLKLVFEDVLSKLKQELLMYESLKSSDIDEINNKITKLEMSIEKSKIEVEGKLANIELSESEINKIDKKIANILEIEKNKVISSILEDESLDQDEISLIVKDSLINSAVSIRTFLENNINDRIGRVFEESNEIIKSVSKEIDINLDEDIHIGKPTLQEIECGYFESKLNEIREKRYGLNEELAITCEELQSIKEIEEMKKEELKAIQSNVNKLKGDKLAHGTYKPMYEECIEEGGASTGAMVGRIIGEVADMALLFTTPATEPLKVLDVTKDTAKVTKMVVDSTKNLEKSAKNVNKVKKGLSKTSAFDKLKYLEIGFYGEKIGQAIGESIKPQRTILKENEEMKEVYLERKREIQDSIQKEMQNLIKIKSDKEECLISMGEYRKRKVEIESKLKRYEDEEVRVLSSIEKERELNEKAIVERHYKECISEIYSTKYDEASVVAMNIISDTNGMIIERSNQLLEQKLEELKDNLSNLSQNREDIQKNVALEKDKVEELKNYNEWIDEWLS